jgi:putative ABC transport system permease protein
MQLNLRETVTMSLDAIWSHKMRSGLTILGIVVGITTVVTVASLLTGLNNSIVEFFKEFGPNSIFIARTSGDPSEMGARPKELKRRPIRPEDAEYLLATVHSIDAVAISLYPRAPSGQAITAKVPGYESDNLMLMGTTPNLYDISPREMREGRLFNATEERAGMRVAVLGASLADALFPSGNVAGRTMLLDGVEFRILGVFAKAKGGFFGENGLDRQVVLPLATARLRYPASKTFYLTARAIAGKRDDAFEELRSAMRKLRHTPAGKDDDFSITTPDAIIQNFQKVTGMILLVSIAISAVGLLVGGIGVMNIMLVSVTERTREIGVRKAIGATRQDIVAQFLTEAVTLTGAGGIIGIAFSLFVVLLVSLLFPSLNAQVPTWAVVSGIVMSVGVGVFFGVWPAVMASKLDPVEALRYE